MSELAVVFVDKPIQGQRALYIMNGKAETSAPIRAIDQSAAGYRAITYTGLVLVGMTAAELAAKQAAQSPQPTQSFQPAQTTQAAGPKKLGNAITAAFGWFAAVIIAMCVIFMVSLPTGLPELSIILIPAIIVMLFVYALVRWIFVPVLLAILDKR